MGNYTKVVRKGIQKLYGDYCNLCRKNNKEIVPYHNFVDNYKNLLADAKKESVKMENVKCTCIELPRVQDHEDSLR